MGKHHIVDGQLLLQTDNGLYMQYAPIEVEFLQRDRFRDGLFQAQLRQRVMKIYPAVRIGNSLSDQITDIDKINISAGQKYITERVTWLHVDPGSTRFSVSMEIRKYPESVLYRLMSNRVEDVLSNEQLRQIETGFLSVEHFRYKHRVPDAPEQYRNIAFSKQFKEDVDYRTEYKSNEQVLSFNL